ncbi:MULTISPECIES: hypothetical protein [Shewanella]|jgi:hypothetical protein|uniref:hypothetical protein n=2 Tax=Shewanellaceae TaxID=267890 RepID=UPI000849C6CB|nr:hypothetical protein [Shewanella xiamenensis]MBW0298916.1 hypothetical protein [Shewanella xiamenensis]MCT8865456.1 hypothetical protein [Shewanella xiamenensis]MCT8878326.1 hypothetical protein [Shewanella xiamenensis]ODR83610.1 hypothetical protein ABT47_22760 [Shewanella xiamenensis]
MPSNLKKASIALTTCCIAALIFDADSRLSLFPLIILIYLFNFYISRKYLLRVDRMPNIIDRIKLVSFSLSLLSIMITLVFVYDEVFIFPNVILTTSMVGFFTAFLLGIYTMNSHHWQLKSFTENSKLTFGIKDSTITPHFNGSAKNLRSAIQAFGELLTTCIKNDNDYVIKLKSPLLNNPKFKQLLFELIKKYNTNFMETEIMIISEKRVPVNIILQIGYWLTFTSKLQLTPSECWRMASTNWTEIELSISPVADY